MGVIRMKFMFCVFLLVSPACFALELQHASQQQSAVGRQFSDDELINYSVWGFIAGLMDYFIRQQFSTTATVATKVADTEGAVDEMEVDEDEDDTEIEVADVEQVKKVRNKKKQKKNKKNKNKNAMKMKKVNIENKMEEEDLSEATV